MAKIETRNIDLGAGKNAVAAGRMPKHIRGLAIDIEGTLYRLDSRFMRTKEKMRING